MSLKLSGTAVNATVVTSDEKATVTALVAQGLMAPLTGATNEVYTVKEVRYVAGVFGALGFVGGGMLGRRRALAMKKPIAGFIC